MNHAAGIRTVPEDGDGKGIALREFIRLGKSERGGDRRGGMPRAEGVVLTLLAKGKARKSARRAQGVEAVFPPGENLMHVTLMSDVEENMILRRIEDAVDRDGQLDDAEIRGEVSPAP